MSIPAGCTKVSIIGTMEGADVFDTGFFMEGLTIASAADANTAAASMASIFDSVAGKSYLLGLMAVGTNITEFRVYHYTGGPTATFVGSHLQAEAGQGTAQLPAQVAVVATTLTGFSGRSNRGRMYWPADGADLSGGHQLPAALVGHVAGTVAEYFHDIKVAYPGITGPCVVSQTNTSYKAITSVKVDSKPDIQRRRANKVTPITTAVSAV